MDLAIIDTFVRSEAASKTAPRSTDDAPESFAELLDTRMRQPEPARERPDAPEAREIPEARPEAPETKPNEAPVAAKPRVKAKSEQDAAKTAATEDGNPSDAEPIALPAKTPATSPTAAALAAELLNGASETPAEPTGLEIAVAIVPTVAPDKAAANTVLSLLAAGSAPQPDEAPVPGSMTAANAPATGQAAASAPTAAAADFALQLNVATETPSAPVVPTVVKAAETPVMMAEIAAATPAAAAVAAELAASADDEPTAMDLALDLLSTEGEDTLATVTLSPTGQPTAGRTTAGPATTSAYAAQLASQEPGTEATAAPAPELSKPELLAGVGKDAAAQDLTAEADKALLAASGPQEPVITPATTTTENSVRAAAQADAAAQRNARPAALPVAEQVAVRITKAMADGVDRITVKLNPADLGQIDIRMEIGPDGKFNAVFAADRPQTVELLQRDARELARSLQDAGLRADTGSLSFNLRGQQNQGQQNGSPLTALQEAAGVHGDELLAEAMPLPANLYNASNAANGRVDIRV